MYMFIKYLVVFDVGGFQGKIKLYLEMFELNFIDVFRMVFINKIVISVEIGFVILVWV